ncbi:MAG: hypothetical protein SP1CHLAM54_14310 [Chlamydiia bacterium]|nr:hypothetical protein [Chlamydiia bacterium]MCH9616323.1 hypothetical protein [Chlamydiia bacterium]MCH9629691.1 hypothetical protein [Chlamydiia bacterium]
MIINDTPTRILSSRLNLLLSVLVAVLIGLCVVAFFGKQEVDEAWLLPKAAKSRAFLTDTLDFKLFSVDRAFPLAEFNHSVRPLEVNTRPDAPKDREIRLSVENEELSIPLGQKTQVTPLLSMLPHIKNDALDLEVGVNMGDLEKKSHFHFDHLAIHETIDASLLLKDAVILGPDLLIEHYGGEDFAEMKGKVRMILGGKNRFYLSKGEVFSLLDEGWVQGLQKDVPVARVEFASANGVDLTVWNASGTAVEKLHLSVKPPEPIVLKPEQLFTAIRKRTKARASLKVMNKQMVLKTGDWLIKTAKGWHTIQTKKELTALLNDQQAGELFVFDGFEKNAFTGRLYSSSRMSSVPVRLPLQGKKP